MSLFTMKQGGCGICYDNHCVLNKDWQNIPGILLPQVGCGLLDHVMQVCSI